MAKSLNSFKNRLDKLWFGSEVMYNPDTNVCEVTAARRTRYIKVTTDDTVDQLDIDLMQEA